MSGFKFSSLPVTKAAPFQQNRIQMVLDAVSETQERTSKQIAQKCGLSEPTVREIIRQLMPNRVSERQMKHPKHSYRVSLYRKI